MIYRQIEKTDRQKCYKGRQTGIKDSQTDKREMDDPHYFRIFSWKVDARVIVITFMQKFGEKSV